MNIKKQLIILADDLDRRGLTKQAQHVDAILGEFAKQEHEHEDEASYMAKPQLKTIAEAANMLYQAIEDGERLDDWMETYISQAELMITQVFKKHMYHEMQEGACKTCHQMPCECG
jgi:hypothetical protein